MVRAALLASLLAVSAQAAFGQALTVLRIRIVVTDAEGNATPVARHGLLVSENPPSAPPRLIVTAADGTAVVRLRPGNYTVESDRPVTFQGRVYQWTKRVDVAAGADAMLELTAGNADVEPLAPAASATSLETDPSFLLSQWQGSVVPIWTPTTRASAFIVESSGLVATNERAIGNATAVEVQLTPDIKVAARVLVADPMRDVAVLWIDPKSVASVRALPIGCTEAARPAVARGQELFTIGAPLRGQKALTFGAVSRTDSRALVADMRLPSGSAGGPVFAAGGTVVGITSISADDDVSSRQSARIVRVGDACEVVASAQKKMKDVPPPSPIHLPMEPTRPFPANALKEMAQGRVGSLSPPRIPRPVSTSPSSRRCSRTGHSICRSRRRAASAEEGL